MVFQSLETILPILRCPYGGAPLEIKGNGLQAGEQVYPLVAGIPSLVREQRIAPIDKLFQQQYGRKTARRYDRLLKLQSLLFGCWEPSQRRKLAQFFNPPKGGLILEVAVGTGANLPYLARAVGPQGSIVGVDLSLPMLEAARPKAAALPLPIQLLRADGCYLPFKTGVFDAVFHFGGINMFGDMQRAILEMVRVAKMGAPILISDEGMSERRRLTWVGRQLGRINSLNLCRAPFAELPWAHIAHFRLYWLWRELFYVLRFKKGSSSVTQISGGVREEISRRVGGGLLE